MVFENKSGFSAGVLRPGRGNPTPWQRQGRDQRNTQRQRHSDFGGLKAFVGHLLAGTLQKVVGGIVDAGAGYQREDSAQQKQCDRGAKFDGKQPAGQRQRQRRKKVAMAADRPAATQTR